MKTTAKQLVKSTIKNSERGLAIIMDDIKFLTESASPNFEQITRLAIEGQRLQSELRQAKNLLPLI